MTLVEFARRSRLVRLAVRDYIDAKRRGESGQAELERWKVLDADLERAEDLALTGLESEGADP